jgi:hypothetical protein
MEVSVRPTPTEAALREPDSRFFQKLLTAEQVAARTGIELDRLLQLVSDGCIPHVNVDGKTRFLREPTFEWVKTNLIYINNGTALEPLKVLSPTKASSAPREIAAFSERLYFMPAYVFSGVYFLVRDRKVVYVGQGLYCGSRCQQHHLKLYDSVFVMPCPKERLNQVEAAFISLLKPEYNCKHKHSVSGRRKNQDSYAYDNPEAILQEYIT